MTKREIPKLIKGDVAQDERGSVSFINGFTFPKVKRFYIVKNKTQKTNRGWHGHLKESKFVFVPHGSAVIKAVRLDHPKHPNKRNKVYSFVLSQDKPQVLYIPKGYANGMQTLDRDTQVIFFSTATVEDSQKDDFRFPFNYWGEHIWQKRT